MKRTSILNLLAALALSGSGAAGLAEQGSDGAHITVSSPRSQVIGWGQAGTRIIAHSVSVAIGVRDLDLRGNDGWTALERRVGTASQMACNALERAVTRDTIGGRDRCPAVARREAMRAAVVRGKALAAAGTLTFKVGAQGLRSAASASGERM